MCIFNVSGKFGRKENETLRLRLNQAANRKVNVLCMISRFAHISIQILFPPCVQRPLRIQDLPVINLTDPVNENFAVHP